MSITDQIETVAGTPREGGMIRDEPEVWMDEKLNRSRSLAGYSDP